LEARLMRDRIAKELELLRALWPTIQHTEDSGADWFQIPCYELPDGWLLNGEPVDTISVLFNASPAYPTGDPYAFWTPLGLTFRGSAPNNTTPAENGAFGGTWLQFSWAPDGDWMPKDQVALGSNLVSWAKSFRRRFEEGV
jgi:hypothetical protein